MIKVGITGGIGSGKTYISNMFKQLGVPVYNADERAKYLMQNNEELIERIKDTFGKESYQNNQLNRAFLAELVFNNKQELEKLNQLVHPAVEKDTLAWNKLHENKAYTIKEAALLFETDSYKHLDKIILVHATEEQRILRVMERDNVSKEQVLARIKNQMPQLDKMVKADFVINNDGNREVNKVVERIHTFFDYSIAV